jgi:hypothetical protein
MCRLLAATCASRVPTDQHQHAGHIKDMGYHCKGRLCIFILGGQSDRAHVGKGPLLIPYKAARKYGRMVVVRMGF